MLCNRKVKATLVIVRAFLLRVTAACKNAEAY
jgi:hypothetical protein